jgi:hypothetical protein
MPSGINYGASWVEVCNQALASIGAGRISSLDSGGDLVNKCTTFLGEAIETVLGNHPWRGLRKRIELARLADTPAWGFSYQYQLPNDFINPVQVVLDGDDDLDASSYSIEGMSLLTDAETVQITYVPRPTNDASILPGVLKKAIRAELAALLAPSVRSSGADRSRALAKLALEEAVYDDGRKAVPQTGEKRWEDYR